jgi:protein ImuB
MTAHSQNARWLAIYLPRLSTDRLIRSGRAPADDRPLATYTKEAGAFQLTGVDARASKLGLKLAMSLADARAIQPKLEAVEAEPEEDARALDNIAAWCERFTPIVVLDPPEGLFLDITGCPHLFGGEESLRKLIVTRLTAQGFTALAAIADTPGAAWAFARYKQQKRPAKTLRAALEASLNDSAESLRESLSPLPIEALRLDPDAAALIRRFGLKTIGQLIEIPRSSFTARGGENAMLRLDQALGRVPEALTPRRPPPMVFSLRRFLEPIFSTDAVLVVTQALCEDAAPKLELRGAGVLRAELVLFGVDGRDRIVPINVSRPLRDVKALMRLFREKLGVVGENMNAEFGFEAARLDVVRIAPMEEKARALVSIEEAAAGAEKISEIVDILSSRLGGKRVLRPQLHEEHAPERAAGWRSALSNPPPRAGEVASGASRRGKSPADSIMRRPVRLYAPAQSIEVMASVPDGPPIRFRWRRVTREVVRSEGPERIAGDWLKREVTRDYYRVEDKQGRRYWLYREGLYGESEEQPRWFVHGLFA